MAIRQNPGPSWKLPSWSCQCDYCGVVNKKTGAEAGDASENARKEGFTAVSIRVEVPMKWACPKCGTQRLNGKGAHYA
jgi:rubredoxin